MSVTVGCDLFLDLRLYKIPRYYVERLEEDFGIRVVNLVKNTPDDIDIYWGNRIEPVDFERYPSLKWIHFGSVGINRALQPSAEKKDIIITNSRGIMTEAVASTALAFMFSLARGLHYKASSRKEFDRFFDHVQDVYNQTALIIGLGEVGDRIKTVCSAMGMTTYSIRKNTISQLDNLLPKADYVFNLLPLTSETKKIIGYWQFQKMKDSAFLST